MHAYFYTQLCNDIHTGTHSQIYTDTDNYILWGIMHIHYASLLHTHTHLCIKHTNTHMQTHIAIQPVYNDSGGLRY